MFDMQTESFRPKQSRAQTLHVWFFATGVLLNVICVFNRPQHRHHGVWFWLSLCAYALMLIGVVINLSDYFAKRGQRRDRA